VHDISLGITIQDYLTGESIEATTYEDLRQALARLLVEELGYPRSALRPRVAVTFPIEGRLYSRVVDYAACDEAGAPLLAVLFCSGDILTYQRESLAAARLMERGPAALVAVTDTRNAVLLATRDGAELGRSMAALPRWETLLELARAHSPRPLGEAQRDREGRILFAYSESLYSCCGHAVCAAETKGGRWRDEGGGRTDGEGNVV